jgi:hypothetical protein
MDYDGYYPTNVITCPIVEIAAKYHFGKPLDLRCNKAETPLYTCQTQFGQKVCGIAYRSKGLTKEACEKTCHDTTPSFIESILRQI